MKMQTKLLLFTLTILSGIHSNAQYHEQWASCTSFYRDSIGAAQRIAVDPSGNVHAAGYVINDSTGESYLTIMKYDSSGVPLWGALQSGNPLADPPTTHDAQLRLDVTGNVYVLGMLAGNGGILLVKYNSAGEQQWLKAEDGLWNNYNPTNIQPTDMVVNDAGVFVCGFFHNGITDHYEAFLLQYNLTTGQIALSPGFNSSNATDASLTGKTDFRAQSMAVDLNGNIYAAGFAYSSNGSTGILLLKYNGAGSLQMNKGYFEQSDDFTIDKKLSLKLIPQCTFPCSNVGQILIGASCASGARLISIGPNGGKKWDKAKNETDFVQSAVDADANCYILTGNSLSRYSKTGTATWTYTISSSDIDVVLQTRVADNKHCFILQSSSFSEVDDAGNLLWSSPIKTYLDGSSKEAAYFNPNNPETVFTSTGKKELGAVKFLPCSQLSCNYTATKKITNVTGAADCDDGKIKINFTGTFKLYPHLELYDADDTLIAILNGDKADKNQTFTELTSGTYHVKVFDAVCCENNLTNLQVKCPKPTGLFANSITQTTATVHWNNMLCNDGYKLQYRQQGNGNWTTKNPALNTTSFTVTGLVANKTYEYRLTVNCANTNKTLNSGYTVIQTFATQQRQGDSGPSFTIGQMEMFPNPANSLITISFSEPEEIISLEVWNVVGEKVIEKTFPEEKSDVIQLHISSLPAGVYEVQLRTMNGVKVSQFVKQ